MCYNGECWPVSKNDLEYLDGTNFRLLRRIVNKQADEHISRDRVLQLYIVSHTHRETTTTLGWSYSATGHRSHNNVTAELENHSQSGQN